jgi:ribosome-associated protein
LPSRRQTIEPHAREDDVPELAPLLAPPDGALNQGELAVDDEQVADEPYAEPDPATHPGRDLALRIAAVIADSPASNTIVLDIHRGSSFADFFVLCSGENERQLRAIVRDIAEGMSEQGVRPHRTEGSPLSGWTLLDFGDVIVHVLSAEQRAFYRLEELWADAQTLLTIQ